MNKNYRKWLISLSITFGAFLMVFGCNNKREKEFLMDKIISVKIYTHKGDFTELFKEWKQIGINTVFCSVELYSNGRIQKKPGGSIETTLKGCDILVVGKIRRGSGEKGHY